MLKPFCISILLIFIMKYYECLVYDVLLFILGVDRLSAWPIIEADIPHFTDYRYRPFFKIKLPIQLWL